MGYTTSHKLKNSTLQSRRGCGFSVTVNFQHYLFNLFQTTYKMDISFSMHNSGSVSIGGFQYDIIVYILPH